jgi:hypothetical protein
MSVDETDLTPENLTYKNYWTVIVFQEKNVHNRFLSVIDGNQANSKWTEISNKPYSMTFQVNQR